MSITSVTFGADSEYAKQSIVPLFIKHARGENGEGLTSLDCEFEKGSVVSVPLEQTPQFDPTAALSRWQDVLNSLRTHFWNESQHTTRSPYLQADFDGSPFAQQAYNGSVNRGAESKVQFLQNIRDALLKRDTAAVATQHSRPSAPHN